MPDFELEGIWASRWYPHLLHSRLMDRPPKGRCWTVEMLSEAYGIPLAEVWWTLQAMAERGLVVLERPGPRPRARDRLTGWVAANRVRLPLDPSLEALDRWIEAELEGAR